VRAGTPRRAVNARVALARRGRNWRRVAAMENWVNSCADNANASFRRFASLFLSSLFPVPFSFPLRAPGGKSSRCNSSRVCASFPLDVASQGRRSMQRCLQRSARNNCRANCPISILTSRPQRIQIRLNLACTRDLGIRSNIDKEAKRANCRTSGETRNYNGNIVVIAIGAVLQRAGVRSSSENF
jgi:hypothetical protein